jgi:glycosyltransferase involved in cell wall biosynthesis
MATPLAFRVALVIPAYLPATDYGGPVVKLRGLVSALTDLGALPEVWAADYGPGRGRVPAGRHLVEGIPVRYFRRVAGYHWSPVVPQAVVAGSRCDADIAHCLGMRDGMTHFAALGFRRGNTPYVVETLGMHLPLVRGLGRKRLYDRFLGASYLSGSAGLIATSEREEAALRSAGAQQTWLRYNPVQAMDATPEGAESRLGLGLPADAPMVGWVGRISRSKGLDLLVQAIAQLSDAHLALVGPDDGDGALGVLERAVEASGMQRRVHLLGPLWDDARDRFLASIDAFVLPSVTENFGNAAAEAAAVGLPVVVSDQCGLADLLRRLGAATVVPLEVRALRDAVAAALEHRRSDAGPGTPAAAVRTELSPEAVGRRQLAIYAEVLEASRTPTSAS